ncbi:MAG: LonB [Dehalococcoidia bacterium]|nr:LonB [Dehalococcoidia bacterium]
MQELSAESIRNVCDKACLEFETTAELPPLQSIIGQKRAIQALEFGLGIEERGFNIYAAGPSGTGKTTAITAFMEKRAKTKETAPDWCYVNNFKDPNRPRGLQLPPGKGKDLQRDMRTLIEQAKRDLTRAFESAEYEQQREELIQVFRRERDNSFNSFSERTRNQGFLLQATPMGLVLIPHQADKPMSDEEVASLSAEDRNRMGRAREQLETDLKHVINRVRNTEREVNERVRHMDQEVVQYAMGTLVQELKEKYDALSDVALYLEEVERDVVENIDLFRGKPQESQPPSPPGDRDRTLRRYEVNVLIDNSELKGAPVILDSNPTPNNLFGLVEKEAHFGALQTDFTMIRAGSLHQANGGFLILRIEELLRNPLSWEGLKRCLKERKIIMEDVAERMGFISTKGLIPEPIPLKVKTILLGNSMLYHMLYLNDPDFLELFKVKADFDSQMERTLENLKDYAGFVCTLCHKEHLLQMDREGVSKIVEHSSRLAEDQTKLSTRFAEISDIIREANYWATKDEATCIGGEHVTRAIDEKVYRSDLIRERITEMIRRGVFAIDTEGEAVGQINALAVIGLGDFSFGRPGRITVSVSPGREGLVDIEREARLGGRLHTKGVMILGGYVAERYARDIPLSLSARLTFEQSYDDIEGDSASSAELYALLSRLADLPIRQGIAVTGSVNQMGDVQAIGGVNQKVEGFFHICQAKGLNGQQGVMIPATNVQNLMLREEVVEAVRQGLFHIYTAATVDEGIEVLTGVKAGAQQPDGSFEEGSVNQRVQQRLRSLARGLRDFMRSPSEEERSDYREEKQEREP